MPPVPNPPSITSPLALIAWLLAIILISIISPLIAEWFKTWREQRGKSEEEKKTDKQEEHNIELKAIRLEFELEEEKKEKARLVQKIKRFIWFVRNNDPALGYIMSDLEIEISAMGFDPSPLQQETPQHKGIAEYVAWDE